MRVMILVKATADSERGFVLDAETRAMMAAMGKFNDELQKAGILVTADGLKPSSAGKRGVRWRRPQRDRRAVRPSQ